MNKILRRGVLCALLAGALATSCIGPFNAVRRVHTWNREIQVEQNRWLGEGVFLVFRAAWVYTIAFVGDVLIFNSIQFWGGENPIDPPDPERLQALWAADDARADAARAEEEAEAEADGDGDEAGG